MGQPVPAFASPAPVDVSCDCIWDGTPWGTRHQKEEELAEVEVDTEALRAYLEDYYGTAMMSGFPAAAGDLADVEAMDPYELCEAAERLGVDLSRFAT